MLGGSGDADGEAFAGRGGGRATGGASVGIEGVAAAAWTGVAADEMATHSIKVRNLARHNPTAPAGVRCLGSR